MSTENIPSVEGKRGRSVHERRAGVVVGISLGHSTAIRMRSMIPGATWNGDSSCRPGPMTARSSFAADDQAMRIRAG
jgi:hypothetical protein